MRFQWERSGKNSWGRLAVLAVPILLAQDPEGEKGRDYEKTVRTC